MRTNLRARAAQRLLASSVVLALPWIAAGSALAASAATAVQAAERPILTDADLDGVASRFDNFARLIDQYRSTCDLTALRALSEEVARIGQPLAAEAYSDRDRLYGERRLRRIRELVERAALLRLRIAEAESECRDSPPRLAPPSQPGSGASTQPQDTMGFGRVDLGSGNLTSTDLDRVTDRFRDIARLLERYRSRCDRAALRALRDEVARLQQRLAIEAIDARNPEYMLRRISELERRAAELESEIATAEIRCVEQPSQTATGDVAQFPDAAESGPLELDSDDLAQSDLDRVADRFSDIAQLIERYRTRCDRSALEALREEVSSLRRRLALDAYDARYSEYMLRRISDLERRAADLESQIAAAEAGCPEPSPSPSATQAASRRGFDASLRALSEEIEQADTCRERVRIEEALNRLRSLEREISNIARGDDDLLLRFVRRLIERAEARLRECPPAEPLPTGTASVERPDETAAMVLTPSVGFGEADRPPTGIGFQRDGPPGAAPERFAGELDRRIAIIAFGLNIELPQVLNGAQIDLGYAEGDQTRSFDIAGGTGVDSGIVYGDLSPTGSSGIASPLGSTGGVAIDSSAFRGRVALPIVQRGGLVFQATFNFERTRSEIAAEAVSASTTFAFDQQRNQIIVDNLFGVGFDTLLEMPVAGLILRPRLAAEVYYRDSDLRSTERNRCNFCPTADRDFTINIDDSDNGWGFHLDAGAMLELPLSPRFSVFASGQAEYRSSVGSIFNPNSGDQVFFEGLTTGISTDDAWSWRAGAGVIIRFGRD